MELFKMKKFVRIFEAMTKSDVQKVSKLQKSQYGIKRLVGCIDPMHVHWKNYLYSLLAQHVGKDGFTTLVVEARCDYNLFLAS